MEKMKCEYEKNFIKAQLKFNNMYELLSIEKNDKNLNSKLTVLYNYGINLIKLYPQNIILLTETVSILHSIETLCNLKQKVLKLKLNGI
jgi:hypothetical protein